MPLLAFIAATADAADAAAGVAEHFVILQAHWHRLIGMM